jgi:Rrf2 family protein
MLSQQSKYALRAVQHLKTLKSGTLVRVEEIAKATDLPAAYLSKVLKLLVHEKLLESRRGKNGGVALMERRKPLTFMDICKAVEDPIVASECVLRKQSCNLKTPCAFHLKWSATKKKLLLFLEREIL